MAWCLTRSEEQKFREALANKDIDPFELADMASEQRRDLFNQYVDEENAIKINSLYESKLLVKNRVQGFKTWAKRALGMQPQTKRDLLSKIERLEEIDVLNPQELKSFKQDLARTRLGFNITFDEAKKINQLSQERTDAKESWKAELKENPEWDMNPHDTRKEWIDNEKRIEYGLRARALEKYVDEIQLRSRKEKVSFAEDPVRALLNPIKEAPSFFNDTAKSLMAAIDNSFFGRQGIKNLFGSKEQKKIWVRTFTKSFSDISAELQAKEIEGFEPMDFVRADIFSRPNALNGKYKAGGYQLGVLNEEVFPTSLPEKVPGLGRLFKASETAYTGGALRMRADLADLMISKMEERGINALRPSEARGPGHLVGSLTGRGSLGKATPLSKELNFVLWSARFFKSNIDTLTAHQFDPQATQFTKSEARKNLASIVAHVAGIMLIAGILDPDSVDPDPRSTNFGKIKVFGKWIDITGSMRSIAIMAARLMPTRRNGEWGIWSKSSTGNWTNLTAGEYGQRDAVDVLMDTVFLNKLAPFGSIMRDFYRGEMFGGDPFDIKKSITNSATPLSIQNINDVKDESAEVILAVAISEFFGLSVSDYKYEANWERNISKEMQSFKEQVGEDDFKKANNDYNRAYDVWFEEVQKDPRYKELSDDGKSKLKSDARRELKKKILDEYGYFKEKEFKTKEELEEEYIREGLEPKEETLRERSQLPESDKTGQGLVDKINKFLDNIVPEATAAEEGASLTEDERGMLDKINDQVQKLGEVINIRKKSGLLSPQPVSVLEDEVDSLIKKGEQIIGREEVSGEDVEENQETGEVLQARSGNQGEEVTKIDVPQDVSDIIKDVFGDKAQEAVDVLHHPYGETVGSKYYGQDPGTGENTSFKYGEELDISNEGYSDPLPRKLAPGDMKSEKDGKWYTSDRGLFRINSGNFTESEFNRMKSRMKEAGIDVSSRQAAWDDMLDPRKNAEMAKIIYKEGGWKRWFAAPAELVED